jgi:hypothetical protein
MFSQINVEVIRAHQHEIVSGAARADHYLDSCTSSGEARSRSRIRRGMAAAARGMSHMKLRRQPAKPAPRPTL